MDVDVVDDPSGMREGKPQPVQRAKRTYGSKRAPQTVLGDEGGPEVSSLTLSDGLEVGSPVLRPLATSLTTSSLLGTDWREHAKKIDERYKLSDDEDDETINPIPLDKNHVQRQGLSEGSGASSPETNIHRLPSDASRTPMRPGNSTAGPIRQLSGNTSFASGTSAAVSSPSSQPQSHIQRHRPGPPPHAESFQPDDDDHEAPEPEHSSQSEPPSPQQLLQTLRAATPENNAKYPGATRLLSASPFTSPVKSFSKATKVRRAPPKFLGDGNESEGDGDGDQEMEVIREEDGQAWWSDGSASGNKTKKKSTEEGVVKNKVKKPTKKEIVEAEKETARMRAEKDLDVQDKAEFVPKTFAGFFQKKLQHQQNGGRVLEKLPPPPPPFARVAKEDLQSLDPIRNFSSSSPHHDHAAMDEDQDQDDEEDRELDPERMIAATQQPKRTLHQMKIKAMQMAQKRMFNPHDQHEDDDSDLELEIVAAPPPPPTAMDPIARLAGATAGRKRPQAFPGEGKKPRTSGTGAGGRGPHRELSKEEHNRAMRTKAAAQSTARMAEKKADFLERGGLLTKANKAATASHVGVREFLIKGAAKADALRPLGGEGEEEGSDADDEAYEPHEEGGEDDVDVDVETLQGSSPSKPRKPTVLVQNSSTVIGEDGDEDAMEEDSEEEKEKLVPSAQRRVSSDDDDEDEDAYSLAPAALARRRPQVVISDDEDDNRSAIGSDDENLPPMSAISRSTGGFSFPKFTQRTLNDSSPRTPLGDLPTVDGKKKGMLFSGSFSFSPGQPLSPSQQRMTVNLDASRESSPSKGPLLPAFGEVSFGKRSKTSSNKSSSPFGFAALFGGDDDENSMSVPRSGKMLGGFKPADFGAISTQLFQTQSSPSQRASPSKRNRPSLENKDHLAKLRANPQDDDFFFSQAGPLGRITVSTQEAKAIKEAEQRDAVEVLKDTEEERLKRLRETEADNEPRWINDAGLFTQTKPADLPWSLTQNLLSQTPFSQGSGASLFPRSGELNAEQLLSQRSPAKSPARPRRLRRKGELEEADYALGEALPASPVVQPNAFDALMKPKTKTKTKGTAAVVHNDFVQGEAEESDDELQLGFAKRRTEEDEEAAIDPEEEAKLVDDTKLTDAQIREDAVVEKHLEHLAEDDAANQRIQEMAIKGQLRKNKRGHGMMEDDSSDDERTARGAKFKKRRVVGIDHLDDLAVNSETMAFHQSYIKDLPGVEGTEEEHNEFAHLNKVVDDVGTDGDAESDVEEDSEMLSGSEAGAPKRISVFDVRQRIREMGARGEDLLGEEELQDAEDFVDNFMPSSDGLLPAEYANITKMDLPSRPGKKIQKEDLDILPPPRGIAGLMGDADRQKLALWAKQNEKARDISARGTASAAVTGHSKAASRPKPQQGSLEKSRSVSGMCPPVRQGTDSSLGKLGKSKSAAWE